MVHKSLDTYRQVYSHLWQTYGRQRTVRVSFVMAFVARTIKFILLPIATSIIIARLSQGDYAGAYWGVVFFAVSSVSLGVLNPLIKYIGMIGENYAYRIITTDYFTKLIMSDIDYFHSRQAGYLTTATRQYTDACMGLVRNLRDRYLSTILTIAMPVIVIIIMQPIIGLVIVGLVCAQSWFLLRVSGVVARHRAQSREYYKKHSGYMSDAIGNILAIKSAAQEHARIEQVKQNAVKENDVYRARYIAQSKYIAFRELMIVSFFIITLSLTVWMMSRGYVNLQAAILVITYTTIILNGVHTLADDIDEHDDSVDKLMPAFELLNRQNDVVDPVRPERLGEVRGDIAFENISFAYRENKSTYVFKDFHLVVPAGQKIGVVGLSGAGKSTLTKLLLRFNDVSEGNVKIDGIDVRDVTQAELRRNIAYVPQEPLLFHASIRENIIVSRPDAREHDVMHAAKASHAKDFIGELPQGMDSIVGERGVKLSGGQKQRIAIARAVLQAAPIMILDEATSALDSESEAIIKGSFQEILHGKTAIVVAHRLSTLSDMDRIIVIDKGRLIEDGTHEELLSRSGTYAKLWHRQQRLIEDAA